MMWRRSLSRPGLAGLAGLQPLLARLAALPGPRGEAEDLDLDAAALQRAGQDVGARRRDRDRAPAHRAGVVEKERDHRVAEVRVLLALERERLERIDDDARQPRRIELPFLEVELPGAVLLRQQTPLQAVRETADHALQVGELLVEIGAQPRQLVGVAQVLGVDDLVELLRERLVVRPTGLVGARCRRTPGLRRLLGIGLVGLVGHLPGGRVGGFRRSLLDIFDRLVGDLDLGAIALRRLLGLALGLLLVLALRGSSSFSSSSSSKGGSSAMSSEARRSRTERAKARWFSRFSTGRRGRARRAPR